MDYAGGPNIFSEFAQVIVGINTWRLDAGAAIEAGRARDRLYFMQVEV